MYTLHLISLLHLFSLSFSGYISLFSGNFIFIMTFGFKIKLVSVFTCIHIHHDSVEKQNKFMIQKHKSYKQL